eukprot:scaffold17958_cov99-Isochrysis_galbana.AAC.2
MPAGVGTNTSARPPRQCRCLQAIERPPFSSAPAASAGHSKISQVFFSRYTRPRVARAEQVRGEASPHGRWSISRCWIVGVQQLFPSKHLLRLSMWFICYKACI